MPSQPGPGFVGTILITEGLAEHVLLALDTEVLTEVEQQEHRSPGGPAHGHELSQKAEPSEYVNGMSDLGIEPLSHQFPGLGPYREGIANLMASQHPQKETGHRDRRADPVMRIAAPVDDGNYGAGDNYPDRGIAASSLQAPLMLHIGG